jgi:predicted lipoprotein with Yx(FWY)xxD motif
MKSKKIHLALLALAAAIVLVASACGGSSDTGAAASGAASGTGTVSVRSVDGVGDVLVDAKGSALYASEQEAGGTIVCTGACVAFWSPLTVGAGRPSAAGALHGKLGLVSRPDGARQVTFRGRPLYRFTQDPSPGVVTGNGFADSFGGRSFTWHVATPSGVARTSANSSDMGESTGSLYR